MVFFWHSFPPTQVEKKNFPKKKKFWRKSKVLSSAYKIDTQTHTQHTPNQPQTNFRSMGKGAWHSKIWMRHHFATFRPCKPWPPAIQNCIHMNKWISIMQNHENRSFRWSKLTTPEHQQHMCHTEGLQAMAHHSEIARFWSPGLQKLWIIGWNQPNSSTESTTKTENLPSTVSSELALADFSDLHQGHGHTTSLENTVPTPFGN